MSPKTWSVGVISELLIGSICFNIATPEKVGLPQPKPSRIIGATLANAFTSVPVHPDNPDQL
jgi:hypothetical protein